MIDRCVRLVSSAPRSLLCQDQKDLTRRDFGHRCTEPGPECEMPAYRYTHRLSTYVFNRMIPIKYYRILYQ